MSQEDKQLKRNNSKLQNVYRRHSSITFSRTLNVLFFPFSHEVRLQHTHKKGTTTTSTRYARVVLTSKSRLLHKANFNLTRQWAESTCLHSISKDIASAKPHRSSQGTVSLRIASGVSFQAFPTTNSQVRYVGQECVKWRYKVGQEQGLRWQWQ